jgi:hypothetical protein|uniref:Uncharacterized protein n=1 Tax=Siphoviridae sp. ctP6113 TaxID=2826318 RepID=A0A8S5MU76_9CAUD|nr:MAG TPA: hypothetical protein [Siphoviridae sp. ctP6113]
MAEIVTMAQDELRKRGAADAAALAAKAVSGDADGTALISAEDQIPTWRQRDYSSVPVGTPYRWQGQVYKLWQQHDATNQPDWSPDRAVSLWDICHTSDPAAAKEYQAPQGSRGLYQTGECCLYGGNVWKSKIDNNSWTPDAYPAGWENLGAPEVAG